MVVHGQPKEDGEQEQRDPRVNDLGVLEPQQVRAHTILEHQHQQPVGCAHGQQVHDDGLDRDDDGPEDQHQDDEAGAEHERKDNWCELINNAEEVGGLSGHAPNIDLRGHAFERRGDVHLAQIGQIVGCCAAVGFARERKRQQRQVAGLVGLDLRRHREGRIVLKRLHQSRYPFLHLRVGDISVDDDLRGAQYPGGTDRSHGEFLFKDDERRLRLGFVRESVDVVEPCLDAEVKVRQRNHGNGDEEDADDGEARYGVGYGHPEPMRLSLRRPQGVF